MRNSVFRLIYLFFLWSLIVFMAYPQSLINTSLSDRSTLSPTTKIKFPFELNFDVLFSDQFISGHLFEELLRQSENQIQPKTELEKSALKLAVIQYLALQQNRNDQFFVSFKAEDNDFHKDVGEVFKSLQANLAVDWVKPSKVIYFGNQFYQADPGRKRGKDLAVAEIEGLNAFSVNDTGTSFSTFIRTAPEKIKSNLVYAGPNVNGTEKWLKLAVLIHDELKRQNKSASVISLLTKAIEMDLEGDLPFLARDLVSRLDELEGVEKDAESGKGAFFFYVDGSLLPSSDKKFKLNHSPAFQELLQLLKLGYTVGLATDNNFKDGFMRIIKPIPEELRSNIVFYANGLASKYRFKKDPGGKEEIAYRKGKELTKDELKVIERAVQYAIQNYEFRRNDETFSKPFPRWLKEEDEQAALLKVPIVQKRGHYNGTYTQVTVKNIASRLAAAGAYPEEGPAELKLPDARELFIRDILEMLPAALKRQLSVAAGGYISVDIKRKDVTRATAVKDFLNNLEKKRLTVDWLSGFQTGQQTQNGESRFMIFIQTEGMGGFEDLMEVYSKKGIPSILLKYDGKERKVDLLNYLKMTSRFLGKINQLDKNSSDDTAEFGLLSQSNSLSISI